MSETNAERLAHLKEVLKDLITRRNVQPMEPAQYNELTKDIHDTRTVIAQLEVIIQEGHP